MKTTLFRLAPVLLLLLLAGCASESVVLLPMPDGRPSAVTVTPRGGQAVVLDQPGQAVDVGGLGGSPYTLSEQRIQSRYGQVIKELPEPPKHFLIYFESGTAVPLRSSTAQLPQVLEVIKTRHSTDVSVVGHADREGDRKWNYTLSRMRADTISRMLKKLGVDPEIMEITSHGEENPLIPTPDGVAEPRNRRVEVIVR